MFSLIFHEFLGASGSRAEAFQRAFGESGCYNSLESSYEKYAPCELAANLTLEDAQGKAAILREADMAIDVVPTAEVTNVKHRAFEFWPTHRASSEECFTERDFFVVRGVSLDMNERIQQWTKSWFKTFPRPGAYEFELSFNHEHPTNTLDRHGLRMARERGAEIGAALTECFPERYFLLVYRDQQLSFCQYTEKLPLGITSGANKVVDLRVSPNEGDVCFCEMCERANAYVARSQPDAEFPNAQFADCTVCGNEMILWTDPEVVLAAEAARRHFPTPEIPIDAWERSPFDVRLPASFAELKAAVGDRLHPSSAWRHTAIRLWLGREEGDLSPEESHFAQTLLQIEELTALLLRYRIRQLSLPLESQDRSPITPERLGIARSSPLYHPARRALAAVTVVTFIEGKTTSHALLNGTDEQYTAGRRLDPKYAYYEGRFGYGVLDTQGRTFWRTHPDGKQYRVVNDTAPHGANPWTCSSYGAATSLKFVREQGTERCIAFTLLYDAQNRVIAQHRRLFRRFHELDMNPNPSIDLDLSEGILTLRSDTFVWGVFLGWQNGDKLSDNAFDLLPRIPYSLPYDESVCGPPKIWRTGNSLLH